MDHIESRPTFVPRLVAQAKKELKDGVTRSGEELTELDRSEHQRLIDDSDLIHAEYQRLEITAADISFEEVLRIHSGSFTIELLYLGDGNTAGDIVVHPTPYGFNVPPRRWADTMQRIQDLSYDILVPGHGAIQRDGEFVDLLIECARSVADQVDALVAKGVPLEEAEGRIDFSAFEERFTQGNPLWKQSWDSWFTEPMRKAAFKALTGEPMVIIHRD